MGKYSAKLEANRNMTPAQIRAAKCERSHTRNLQRKADKRAAAEQRNANWQSLSLREQLAELKRRPGKSAKQIKKIKERLDNEKK